jgi:sulfoxide reductase catalytic subunit YedY
MPSIIVPPGWRLPERDVTPEHVYFNRRVFLKQLGILGLGALGVAVGCGRAAGRGDEASNAAGTGVAGLPPKLRNYDTTTLDLYPAKRNPAFKLDRALTDEEVAATYNNFYEFTEQKNMVWKLVGKFRVNPWSIEIDGLCEKPGTYDFYELVRKIPLEERLYRHRCVEAWAMAVPWTGFPLSALMKHVGVKDDARFVRFISFLRPDQAPNQGGAGTRYPWPYFEALRMDEAMNELAFMGTGIYGHPLPKQHGAPFRLITPWKYGYKSAKSIVRIEFVTERPDTFWHKLYPAQYGFLSNVDPDHATVPWSQATERLIGTGKSVPTRPYNGYGEWVAKLYT